MNSRRICSLRSRVWASWLSRGPAGDLVLGLHLHAFGVVAGGQAVGGGRHLAHRRNRRREAQPASRAASSRASTPTPRLDSSWRLSSSSPPASVTLWKGVMASQPTVCPSTSMGRRGSSARGSTKAMMLRCSASSREMRNTAPVRSELGSDQLASSGCRPPWGWISSNQALRSTRRPSQLRCSR